MALDAQATAERALRIKTLREESPYTQQALADACHVSLRAYQRWEAGGGIEWEHLEKLAELHEVDAMWIHRGRGRGPTPDPFVMPSRNGAMPATRLELESFRSEVLGEIARVQQALGLEPWNEEPDEHTEEGTGT